MSLQLLQYRVALTKEEIIFLRRKEEKERKEFYKIARVFMLLCFICSFIVSIIQAVIGVDNPFSLSRYFLSVVYLMGFSALGIYWGYFHNLRKVQQDIRHKTKTIERAYITRKQYMPVNNSYFFYLSSAIKLSIEVEEPDYRRLEVNDEVSIEYTTNAKLYLGYF